MYLFMFYFQFTVTSQYILLMLIDSLSKEYSRAVPIILSSTHDWVVAAVTSCETRAG
jgi:hypothetical protein